MHKNSNSFNSDQRKNLLNLARETLSIFLNCYKSSYSKSIHSEKLYPMIFNGHFVKTTKNFHNSCNNFINLAARMLKYKSAHEDTIRQICIKTCQNFLESYLQSNNEEIEIDKAAQKMCDMVLREAKQEYTLFLSNFLYKLSDTINIGRIEITYANTIKKMENFPENFVLNINGCKSISLDIIDEAFIFSVTPLIWKVKVQATIKNALEEAKWYIDILLSLVRILIPLKGYIPEIGKVEPHPFYYSGTKNQYFYTDDKENFNFSGISTNPWYELDEQAINILKSEKFQSIADTLFNPDSKSLAMRVGQGLGWLSRGRQSSDRSNRLLYFFTALESLLTANDKSEPVVQTISRHLSVILEQDPKKREIICNSIKHLYSIRSAVVHAGKRDVLWNEVNELQEIAESAFKIVLEHIDLKISQDNFIKTLSSASHGVQWELLSNSSHQN